MACFIFTCLVTTTIEAFALVDLRWLVGWAAAEFADGVGPGFIALAGGSSLPMPELIRVSMVSAKCFGYLHRIIWRRQFDGFAAISITATVWMDGMA